MLDSFKKMTVEIKDIFSRSHSHLSNCPFGKPKTQLIDNALINFNMDRSASFLIRDKHNDIEDDKFGFRPIATKLLIVLTGKN